MSNPFDAAVLEVLAEKLADSKSSEPVDGDQLLHDISSFIARYLECSQHQRTILALWVLHTYCCRAAQVTPYLSIQSAEKQSGKTLCLQLLQLLCDFPTLTAGFSASSLLRLLKGSTPTLLLDECQASVGTRAHSKAPTLRALLVRGTHQDPDQCAMLRDRKTFGPKAFAGRGPLPEDLADHSIPIILQPLIERTLEEAQQHGVHHFHLRSATEAVKPLRRLLRDWYSQKIAALLEMPPCDDNQFPPNLSPRQQDIVEPLFQIADIIGGEWPSRIRDAVVAAFEEQIRFDLQCSIQLLADIRDCFACHAYPQRLSTADILEWIYSLPARPWDIDGRFSAHTLARLLAVFEIRPRNQRIDQGGPRRGYQLEDFRGPWEPHLHFVLPQSEIANKACRRGDPGSRRACPRGELASRRACPRGELASRRDKGCNGVSLAHTAFIPSHPGAPEAVEAAVKLTLEPLHSPQLVEDRREMKPRNRRLQVLSPPNCLPMILSPRLRNWKLKHRKSPIEARLVTLSRRPERSLV